MAKAKSGPTQPINQLVDYLRTRRETMLSQWRTSCSQEQTLITATHLSREEFNDQAPALLNILAQRLTGQEDDSCPVDRAREHGLQRWQRGYMLPELLGELKLFYWIVLDEIQLFHQDHTPLQPALLLKVHRAVFKLFEQIVQGSVIQFDQLRQTTAAEQANSLQGALDGLQALSKQRSEHLRLSTHDLRSSFSLMMGATQLLELPTTKKEQTQLLAILNRNLSSIQTMLLQLTDYARVEAGQETVDNQPLDAALLVQEMIDLARPLAQQRNLVLEGEGPQVLWVRIDGVKLQRIVQNLLYNALKYTFSGGVYVSWSSESESRWTLSVQDTGPGFGPQTPAGKLAEQLRPLWHSTSTHQPGGLGEHPLDNPPSGDALKKPAATPVKESEGLGLFIVKKLCELLKASMDIESAPGQGTLIRIRFLSA